MNATEIILSGIVFVLFLGLWDAHNRLENLDRWRHAHVPNPRPKKVRKSEQLEKVIEHKDTTISMLNAQIKDLNAENEKNQAHLIGKGTNIFILRKEVSDLKGELTKVKYDYACEVAGEKKPKAETVKETLERWDGSTKNIYDEPTEGGTNNLKPGEI